MKDLNDLYYYVHAVERGGFAPAGRALGMPKSKLSRRIGRLEERLGVRLIQRSTRHFAVTEIGQAYYSHCKAMLVEAEAADETIEMTRSEPRGIVKMSCPTALLDARVDEMIASYMAQNPRVEIHLDATNRRVDVLGERLDFAVRVRPPPLEDSDLVVRILGQRTQCLVAAPTLIERFGMPQVPADLSLFPTLDLGLPQNQHVWKLQGPDGARADIVHRPRLVTRGMWMLRAAAAAGVGVAQMPLMMVRDMLEDGKLVKVVPQWAPRREIIHVVFPSRRGLLPSVRSLINFLAARFAELDED